MTRYPEGPGFIGAYWRYFRSFLTILSAMAALTPFTLSTTGVLPMYAVHRNIFTSSASFLCVLAFAIVFYSRKELFEAASLSLDSKGGVLRTRIDAWLRPILLAVPVLLALVSGWAVIKYQTELVTSIELAKTIHFAEQRAPESEFAFRAWQVLTSNSPAEVRLSEMRRFQSAWPIPADPTRKEILAQVQVPPFTSILWFWYLLAFVCGELSLCLAALRCFQNDTHGIVVRCFS